MRDPNACQRPDCGHLASAHSRLVGCLDLDCDCDALDLGRPRSLTEKAADTARGRELGRQGQETAQASHAMTVSPEGADWLKRAEERLDQLIQSGQEFTADDVTELVGVAPSPCAIGGLFRGRKRDMKTVGFRESTRPVAHARALRVWTAK